MRALIALLAALYLLCPAPGALLHGLPLGPWGLAALAGLACAAWTLPLPRLGPRRIAGLILALIALPLVKLALAQGGLEPGLVARYYATNDLTGPYERSLGFRSLPATRIDARLEFDERSFPLFFFNDALRWNVSSAAQEALPFSVTWEGYLQVPRAAVTAFAVEASNPVALAVDGALVSGPLPLTAGMHPLRIRYRNPAGSARRLRISVIEGGTQQVLGPGRVFTRPHSLAALQQDRWRRIALRAADGVFLALLASALLLSWRWRAPAAPLAALLLGSVGAALWLWRRLPGAYVSLGGKDDWFTYESYARDICLHGPLMLLGEAAGQARPYYYQILYPYFLALAHLLLGEDLFGVMVLQTSALAIAGVFIYYTAAHLWGAREGWLALLIWSLSIGTGYLQVSRVLLSENLAFLLFPLSGLLLVRALTRPTAARVACAGFVFGLTVLARALTLPALPILLVLTLRSARHRSRRGAAGLTLLLLGSALLPLAAAGLRNHVAAHTLAFLPSSGPRNLLLGNPPPPGIDLSRIDADRWYNRLHLPREVRVVAQYARSAPAAFTAGLLRKLLFCLGAFPVLNGRLPPWHVSPVGLGLWLCAAYYLRAPPARPQALAAAALLAIALVQLLGLVLISPNLSYRHRLILPLYLTLFPFAGYTAARLRGRRALTPTRVCP